MSLQPFDPVAASKEVIGNLTDAIKATSRNSEIPEPVGRQTFNSALLLQAGLRALLDVKDRDGVALPKIFPNDPPALQTAQSNYAEVFAGGKPASEGQRRIALTSIKTAAGELKAQGFEKVAAAISTYAASQQTPSAPDAKHGSFTPTSTLG